MKSYFNCSVDEGSTSEVEVGYVKVLTDINRRIFGSIIVCERWLLWLFYKYHL